MRHPSIRAAQEPAGRTPDGIDGGPKIDDPETVCGDGSKDDDEYCDTKIAAGEEGSCPVSCPPQAGCHGYELEGSDCGARCVEVPIATASNGDGCCPPGFTSATDTDCQCAGADCPECDDEHPCPSPHECCDGLCVDTAGACSPWPCILPGTARDSHELRRLRSDLYATCCCGTGADGCPEDQNKTAPGCGCGVADHDNDNDGTADCNDGCPGDPDKTAPGICGCGRIDSDMGATVSCAGLVDALRHRYRFDGSGTTITDSRGTRHGMPSTLRSPDTGSLALTRVATNTSICPTASRRRSPMRRSRPSSRGTAALLGNASSTSVATRAPPKAARARRGQTYLFVTPARQRRAPPCASCSRRTAPPTRSRSTAALRSRRAACTRWSSSSTTRPTRCGSTSTARCRVRSRFPATSPQLDDINNWFGRSQFTVDPEFDGTLHEFRIYGAALSAGQIALSFADGPDPAYLP